METEHVCQVDTHDKPRYYEFYYTLLRIDAGEPTWHLDQDDLDAGATGRRLWWRAWRWVAPGEWRSGGAGKGVEVPITIAAKDHATGLQILHRETKGVKLNRTLIITGELANRKQISD
jgi:hypothetical protein